MFSPLLMTKPYENSTTRADFCGGAITIELLTRLRGVRGVFYFEKRDDNSTFWPPNMQLNAADRRC